MFILAVLLDSTLNYFRKTDYYLSGILEAVCVIRPTPLDYSEIQTTRIPVSIGEKKKYSFSVR